MESNPLFPQPNGSDDKQKNALQTPAALRRKFDAEAGKWNVDNSKVEMYAPVSDAPATAKEEYLEKIAAKKTTSGLFSGKMLILIAAAVGVLVVIALIGILSGGNKVKNASGEVLGQRIINLESLLAYGDQNGVSGSDLTKVASETSAVLLSRANELAPFYVESDGKTNSFTTPSKETAASYSISQETTDLDKAKANANLNTVYAQTLKDQFAEIESLTKELYANSESTELKAVLNQTYIDIVELSNRLPSNSN